MNTSVSPLPVPIWPMLGLSLILVTVTSLAVTFSSRQAAQIYRAQSRQSFEVTAPILSRELMNPRTLRRAAI